MASSKALATLLGTIENAEKPVALKTLRNVVMLAKNERVRASLGEAGALDIIVDRLINEDDLSVSEIGCLALANLVVDDKNKVRLVENPKFIPFVKRVLEETNEKVVLGGLWVIMNLSTEESASRRLATDGVGGTVVGILKNVGKGSTFSDETHMKALDALVNLAGCAPVEVSETVIPEIVPLLTSTTPDDVLVSLLVVIANASAEMKAPEDLLKALVTFLPSPATFAKSGYRLARHAVGWQVLTALTNLSVQATNLDVLRTSGVVKSICSLLPEKPVHLGATLSCIVLVLANCSTIPQNAELISKYLKRFFCLLDHSQGEHVTPEITETRSMAMIVLVNISGLAQEKYPLLFRSHIGQLIKMLDVEQGSKIGDFAVWILFNLSEIQSIVRQLVPLKCTPPLVKSMKSENLDVAMNAVCTLRNAFDSEEFRKAETSFFEAGAVPIIANLLSSRSPVQGHAANLLCVFAEVDSHLDKIAQSDETLDALARAAWRATQPPTEGVDREGERHAAVYAGEVLKRLATVEDLRPRVLAAMSSIDASSPESVDIEEAKGVAEVNKEEAQIVPHTKAVRIQDEITKEHLSSLKAREVNELVERLVCNILSDDSEARIEGAKHLKFIGGMSEGYKKLVTFVLERERQRLKEEEKIEADLSDEVSLLRDQDEQEERRANTRPVVYCTRHQDGNQEANHLSCDPGDALMVIQTHENGWMLCEDHNQEQGWVAATAVTSDPGSAPTQAGLAGVLQASQRFKVENRSREPSCDAEFSPFPVPPGAEDEGDVPPPPPPPEVDDFAGADVPPLAIEEPPAPDVAESGTEDSGAAPPPPPPPPTGAARKDEQPDGLKLAIERHKLRKTEIDNAVGGQGRSRMEAAWTAGVKKQQAKEKLARQRNASFFDDLQSSITRGRTGLRKTPKLTRSAKSAAPVGESLMNAVMAKMAARRSAITGDDEESDDEWT